MICNFSRRSGIDALAGKIRNGATIDLAEVQALAPGVISPTPPAKPLPISNLNRLTNIIKLPWVLFKRKIEALIDHKFLTLNHEISALNKRIHFLEVNNPPKGMIHRHNSCSLNHKK